MIGTKAMAQIWLYAGLIFAVAVVAGFVSLDNFNLASIGITGTNTIYKQNWGHIMCIKSDTESLSDSGWVDDRSYFACLDYTDRCRVVVKNELGTTIQPSGKYKICDVKTDGCSSWINYAIGARKGSQIEFNVDAGKKVLFSTGLLAINEDSTKWYKYVKTYGIVGEENGRIYTTATCRLNSALTSKVTASGLNELEFGYPTNPNSFQNYMIDWIATEGKLASYDGKDVVCQAKRIYSVNKETFKDGSTRYIQMDEIKAVECCPQETGCTDKFTWAKGDVVPICTITSQCANGGAPVADPFTPKTYYTWSCVSGQCVKSAPQTAQCTSSADCSAGQKCDFSPANWGKCITPPEPEYCGDLICQTLKGENIKSCPADCTCPTGQTTIVKTSKEGGFFSCTILGIGCTERVETSCKTPRTWLTWVLIIVAVVVVIILARPFLKRLPYVGRVIP